MPLRHARLGAALAVCALTVASAGAAQAPAPPRPQAGPLGGASDAALLAAGRGRIRGQVVATARAALPGGDAALLVASLPRPGRPPVFSLLLIGADETGGLSLLGHDDLEGIEVQGTPSVELRAGAPDVVAGALTATASVKAADGSTEERLAVYRAAAGRLSRLLALPPRRTFPPGAGWPSVRDAVEPLPTATGGFRDLLARTTTRDCDVEGDCTEAVDLASYRFDGVRYAARPHAIPFVERIQASSELAERGALVDHGAAAAVDGHPETSWCEGARGPGWFQKLELEFVPAQRLRAVTILPGDWPGARFVERSRPKRIRLEFPDGTRVEADLADEQRAQRIEVPGRDRVFGMDVVIVDVYRGAREDACIAELSMEVEP